MSYKLAIGFITYNDLTAKYLPYFLPSLKEQTFSDFQVIALDNSETKDNTNTEYIRNNFSDIKFVWAGENLGFAKAFNHLIKQAVADGADYFLPLNPDMIFTPKMIAEMVKALESDEKIAAVQSRIFKWDFANKKKTGVVDNFGLSLTKEHRFSDLYQGEADNVQIIQPQEIFGFTGTAVLLRIKALTDVVYNNGKDLEYFDELMFMYKEDCDLSYRLRLAGWKIVLAPQAVAYHDRSVAPKGESNLKIALNRRNKNRVVKQWSYLNQWIIWLKYKNLPFSYQVRIASWWYQIKSLVFIILFEQYLLKELIKLWRLRGEISKRREQLKIRVDIGEIEKFMD